MAARTTHPSHGLGQRHVPFGGRGPYLLVGKQAAGTRVASSPDSDLEAFSHNPAHGSFAPLAFQPSAMTNCANQRKSRHRRIKKQRRYERLAATSQLSLCRIPLVRTSSELAVRRPGKAPEGAVPSPSPGRPRGDPLSPRKQLEQSADSRRVRDWDPPCPALRANPFPEVTDPFCRLPLPTLFHRPEACSPWRPDAVMSTTGRGRHSVLPDFQGPPGAHRTPRDIRTDGRSAQAHAQGFAATAAPSYSSGPGTCPDGRVSAQFGTVTRLPVHPASPVLLTKNGPLGALDSVARLNEAAAPSYLFKNSHPGSSYPEGNFGGNQLLDGSISLSPLYPSQTNDLHVSIAAGLHQSFLWLRPAQA
ncbi:hypothetical protein L1887_49942 [Cichorium endivia]|nr:hypothetical protein L1887_49942 [Cichorium endivia]